jgi:hypothetical protein
MKTEQPIMQRATGPVVTLWLSAIALFMSPAHAAGDAGPDILGVRTGMSPEQVYETLKSIDVTHRVTVAQVYIPALLGNKTAVYAMAPESRNSGGEETMSVWISLPPNPQQVWSVQRQFNGSIHTTIEQIVDSLRQKYGPETVSSMTPKSPEMFWIYDGKGHLADPATGKHIQKDCANYGLQPISISNVPGPPGSQVQAGALSPTYGVSGPLQITDQNDPTKHLDCQGWIQIHAYAGGGVLDHGVFNDTLFVSITDFDIQKRAVYALNQFLTGVANKQLQQDLNKANQQAMPKL